MQVKLISSREISILQESAIVIKFTAFIVS